MAAPQEEIGEDIDLDQRTAAMAAATEQDHVVVTAPPSAVASAVVASLAAPSNVHVDPAVLEVQEFLMDIYKEAEIDIGGTPLVEETSQSVGDMQINLVMITRENLTIEFQNQGFDSTGDIWRAEHSLTSAGKRRNNVTLESLFEDIPKIILKHGKTYRVLAIASGGCGKTTIFTKIATWKWAKKELWPEFDILIALELRYQKVRDANDIWELMALAGHDEPLTKKERTAIRSHFKSHPQRLCLVLDGLDETTLDNCGPFIRKVIYGDTLKGIRMIITSRPCPDILSLCSQKPNDGRIEVIGFRRDDVERYTLKLLGPHEGEGLMAEVKKDEHLLAMMCTPILAREVCILYHYDPRQIPRCLSDIFDLMILRLAGKRHSQRFNSWEDISEDTRQQILELGRFAFRMLQCQRLVFTEADLRKFAMSDEAKLLGVLLTTDRSPAIREEHWRFSHLTFQENLSAKFVAFAGCLTPKYIAHLVESLGPRSGHLRTFWILLAAQLDSPCLETLVNSLFTREKKEILTIEPTATGAENETCFPLNTVQVLCENLSRDQMDRLAGFLLCDVVEDSAVNVVENKMKRSGQSNHEQFLRTLLLHWCEVVTHADEAMLANALQSLNLTETSCLERLQAATLRHSAQAAILLPLPSTSGKRDMDDQVRLMFLCYAEYARHHGDNALPLQTISDVLQDLQLGIQGNDDPFFSRAVNTVIKHHLSDVRYLYLEGIQPTSAGQVPQQIAECNNLVEIHVTDCDIQWNIISRSIENSSRTLVKLGDFCTNLTVVTKDAGLYVSDNDIPCFATALRDYLRLQQLSILVESTHGASATLAAVSSNSSLKSLIVRRRTNTRSDEEDEPLIVPDLRQCSALLSIYMSGLNLSLNSLRWLTSNMKQRLGLRVICIVDCWVSATAEECRYFNKELRPELVVTGDVSPGVIGFTHLRHRPSQ